MILQNLYKQIFNQSQYFEGFARYLEICREKSEVLRAGILANKIAPINICKESADLAEIEKWANKIGQFKKVLLLGVGGSSLGAKTLTAISDEKLLEKIEFLESIDPKTVTTKLEKIDLTQSFFLIVSKSGQTIETICQTLIIIAKLKKLQNHQEIFANNFLFVTESRDNSLAKIAQEIGAPIANHPNDIGGRFSYLSIVGLLPAAICGLDIRKIRKGAEIALEDFLQNQDSNIVESCARQLCLYEAGFKNNVVMPYIDDLKDFTDWYRQLFAESLGKNSFGITPINSMGTVDQHSQLQLYIAGPKDKFFTFILRGKEKENFVIEDIANCKTLFGGKKLSEIVKIEQETTIVSLQEKNLPIRTFIIDDLNEESISAFMMQMFLETILLAKVWGFDPFDQPAVEERKVKAKKRLSE